MYNEWVWISSLLDFTVGRASPSSFCVTVPSQARRSKWRKEKKKEEEGFVI